MARVLCYGEILWDCLPHARHLGGAPFNVAYHLRQLGHEPVVVSAVGNDELGRETLALVQSRGISTRFIAQHVDLPTGTVIVQLDAARNASYTFTEPAAWDRIPVQNAIPQNDTTAVAGASAEVTHTDDAIVFGSLAQRREFNREQLRRLLDLKGPLKVFDVNLRPPMRDRELILALARHAGVLKVNAHELLELTGKAPSKATSAPPRSTEILGQAVAGLSALTGVRSICVTRGGEGALWLHDGKLFAATAPPTQVRDTIGAGDAFTAALVSGILAGESQRSPETVLRRACGLGSFVASRDGAQPAYDFSKLGL
jgi:fructokinase